MSIFSTVKAKVAGVAMQALSNTPVTKPIVTPAKSRPVSMGNLSTEQLVSRINLFFDDLLRVDTDEVLAKRGIQRHQLATLLYDDEIDDKVTRRLENLLQSQYTLSPSEGMVAEFIYAQLEKHGESVIRSAMNAKMYGYSVSEMTWDSENTNYVIKSFMEKPLEWFEPKNDGRLLYFADNGLRAVNLKDDPLFNQRVFYCVHEPTYKNPKGKALLSRVYWLHYYKTNGFAFWAKDLERFGSPLMIGKTADASPESTQDMANAMLASQNNSVIAIGKDDDVQVISGGSRSGAFTDFDNAINKRIAKYLLGQTLTSGTDGSSSYALGVVHQEQQDIIFNSDKKFAETALQRFINILCEMNGFEPPKIEWLNEKGLQMERANRDAILAEKLGVQFDDSYIEDMYDIDKKYIKLVNAPASNSDTPNSPVVSAVALSHFASGDTPVREFTPEQQHLESLADDNLAKTPQPIDSALILKAIKSSKDKTEVVAKLNELVGKNLHKNEFAQLVNASLMVADLHGFVDNTVGQ